MPVVTRFAPSPTGFLHIGGARTALFNWLFAKHHQGTYYLRIEDTDQLRSTEAAKTAIIEGLKWLGLDWDGDIVFQSLRQKRHQDVAYHLLEIGKAYYCYATKEELEAMRALAIKEKRAPIYDGRWRDRSRQEAPPNVKPSIRLKAETSGETRIHDLVQGEVVVQNQQLDDMILLRSDGTPTYMLSVVVDDYDMGITHIIRGDDHLNNSFRQHQIYQAMGWSVPEFAHIPLIHGPDGSKLSKRHGALGVEAYRDMGYLPEALCNYLLRLGWSHGDDEIISREEAITWFSLETIGASPSRLDFNKLDYVNNYYLKQTANEILWEKLLPFYHDILGAAPDQRFQARTLNGIQLLKQRAKTLRELAELTIYYITSIPLKMQDDADILLKEIDKAMLQSLYLCISDVHDWQKDILETQIKAFMETHALKMKDIAPPIRAALTGMLNAPGIYDLLVHFGKDESCLRLKHAFHI